MAKETSGNTSGNVAQDNVAQEWRGRLRAAGLRVTQPRLAVLDAVRTHSHLAADQVSDRVRTKIGTVSTQAIYDALNTLTEHRILRRIEPAGSSMLFEINTGDNHHHIVCRGCGAVVDVSCAVGSMPCAIPQETQGFVIDEAEVTYWGLCPDCSTLTPSADPARREDQ